MYLIISSPFVSLNHFYLLIIYWDSGMNLLLTTLAPINYIGYVEYGNPTKSDYFVLLLLVRESIRLSVCPHTFDIYHRYLWYLASILRSYIQHDNKLKWTYAPQSCLHYRFKRETCYLSCVLPKRKKTFLNIGSLAGVTLGALEMYWILSSDFITPYHF